MDMERARRRRWDERFGAHGTVDCLSVRLRVRLRLRLRACDCDCTMRGHGKHGHGKGTAPQMGRARVLGTNWTLSALQHWFESSLLTSNKAVRVVGIHSRDLIHTHHGSAVGVECG